MSAAGIIAVEKRLCETQNDFARALIEGLSAPHKSLPCKFFYDRPGSVLFERICELPEYYQTRTEMLILKHHASEFARLMGPEVALVEFGAGSPAKARILLDALKQPRAYLPIDIAGAHPATAAMSAIYPGLAVHPVAADFTRPFALPAAGGRRIGFFPGSTVGNFTRGEAVTFLKNAAVMLKGGGLLIGVDLVKDPAILHAAYNDAKGVTAAFNKNILIRANRELGGDFDLRRFDHYAPYDVEAHAVHMYLVSSTSQRVRAAGRGFVFAEGEAIHTEDSRKYTIEEFQLLAVESGFAPRAVWTDANRLFSIHWLETL